WVFEEEPQDLDVFKKRLTMAIRFGTTILDTDSHIGKMLDNLIRALERDDQAWVLYQKGKTVVDIMVKAIKPLGLQNSSGPPRRAPDLEKDSANAAPGESERLLTEKMDKWESARNKKVTKLQGSANKSLGREAKIEGIVSVTTTFLDTGSDAWVDSSSNAAELLISRAVMERLGFSEDELLSHAFAKQEVWDLSDMDKPSAMASVSRLTQVAASSVECGDDGIHCATPNIQVPSAEDEEGERWLKR
ncbi:hypothetical protein DYB26_008863, partial [Aphanomyces astaci]